MSGTTAPSGAALVAAFPRATIPIVDPDTGIATRAFYQYLLSIFGRTGGAPGSDSALGEIQSDFAETDAFVPIDAVLDWAENGGAVPTGFDPAAMFDDGVAGASDDPLAGLLMGDLPESPQTPTQQAITVSASPFSYIAPSRGAVIVSGGVVSAVTYSRDGATSYTVAVGASMLPVGCGDVVTVTYTVAPTMAFVEI